jgi:hypothetical protein
MARAEVHWDEVAIADFTRDATQEAVHIVTERVADDGRFLMPVLDLTRHRPPGSGWSLPPGRLKESVTTRYGTDPAGTAYGEVAADPVYRFTHKKRHAIRPALSEALDAQYGRPVP